MLPYICWRVRGHLCLDTNNPISESGRHSSETVQWVLSSSTYGCSSGLSSGSPATGTLTGNPELRSSSHHETDSGDWHGNFVDGKPVKFFSIAELKSSRRRKLQPETWASFQEVTQSFVLVHSKTLPSLGAVIVDAVSRASYRAQNDDRREQRRSNRRRRRTGQRNRGR